MRLVKRAYKYRLYPTNSQRLVLGQTFGCARFVYNWGLEQRKEAYETTGKGLSNTETSKRLTFLKRESGKEWLRDVSSIPLQQALRNLDRAYTNFFKGLSRYPKFKRKHSRQSVRYTRNGFSVRGMSLSVARIGAIKVQWSRMFSGTPSSITISRNPDGKYFVSILVEEGIEALPFKGKATGIDLGLKDIAVTSDGLKTGNPRYTERFKRKLRMEQKSLSRKQKGSKNRDKQRIKVAKVHAKISNARRDYLHKLSTQIVRDSQSVYVEDLNVSGMIRNRKLSKAIADSSWAMLVNMLEYKCDWYGKKFERQNPKHTSQDCSECGFRNTVLELKDRRWECPECETTHDRDINAAKNVLKKAVGTTVTACGDSVRPTSVDSEATVCEARISSL